MVQQARPVPQFMIRDGFCVAGCLWVGKYPLPDAIPALWDNEYLPRQSELQDIRIGSASYGVSRATPAFERTGIFEYLASAEVTSIENLPPDMVGWELPTGTYAVLPAKGIPCIGAVQDYCYQEWLPQSHDYEGVDLPMFEYY